MVESGGGREEQEERVIVVSDIPETVPLSGRDEGSSQEEMDIAAEPPGELQVQRESKVKDENVRDEPPLQKVFVRKAATADILSKVIVGTFTGSLALSFIFTFWLFFGQPCSKAGTECSAELTAVIEIFKTASSIVSVPLGFVLGFYFRDPDTYFPERKEK